MAGLGILGFTFIFDIGNVAVLVGCVSDDLSAAVRQKNAVGPGHDFAIAALLVTIIVLALLILNGIVETVWLGRLNRDPDSKKSNGKCST